MVKLLNFLVLSLLLASVCGQYIPREDTIALVTEDDYFVEPSDVIGSIDKDYIDATLSQIKYWVDNPSQSPLQQYDDSTKDFDLSGKIWKNVDKNHTNLLKAYNATISLVTHYDSDHIQPCSAFFIDETRLLTTYNCVKECLCFTELSNIYVTYIYAIKS